MIVEIVVGLFAVFVLVYSAEFVVDRLIRIAHHFGVSGTFIGLTALSIGTSLPEIASHVMASFGILSGSLDYKIASATVLGANIGSNIVQQTLIFGIVILLIGKLTFTTDFLKKSYVLMIGTFVLTLVLGFDFTFSRIDGLILFSSFIAYMVYLYMTEKKEPISIEEKSHKIHWDITFAIIGLGVLLGSSTVVLRTTEFIVTATGLGGSLIGVVSLGVASALPEMFTAIQGARKGERGISVGTLIGSNITNPLLAIGLGSMISTYLAPRPLIFWDLPFGVISAGLLLIWLLCNKRKLGKGGAIYLILLYVVYIGIRIIFFSVD